MISWGNCNGMEISVRKCRVLYMGSNNPRKQYSIGSVIIETVSDTARYLGLTLTPDLKWKHHIRNKALLALRRWFNYMRVIKSDNKEILTRIYKLYVRPLLEFPSQIFNTNSKYVINTLERAQARITRNMLFRIIKDPKHLLTYEQRLKFLQLERLQFRRLRLDLICYHKILNDKIIIADNNRPQRTIFANPRHHSKITPVLGSRTQLRHQSFFVRMSKIFNKLPNHIAQLNEPIHFKVALKSIDLSLL